MAGELVFYTHPTSRGRIVRWMLEEIGADYRTEILEYGTTMKAEAYLALNPMGKVPAIRHGDAVVTEAPAICAYLADAFPEAGLAPPVDARGAYYRWLFFAAGPIEAATTNGFLGFEAPKDKEGMVGYGTLGAVLDTLEHALAGGGYVAGERFSAADVYVGSHVGWGLRLGSIEKRDAFSEYWSRLSGREALRRANEIDDALRSGPAGG